MGSKQVTENQAIAYNFTTTRGGTLETTWVERLCLNLLSYSAVLLPMALIVIATRFRLLPLSIQSNSIVQWFVYGSSQADEVAKSKKGQPDDQHQTQDDRKLLLTEKCDRQRGDLNAQNGKSPGSLNFAFCLVGLQISYILWGFLQEKIMTSRYPITIKARHDIRLINNGSHNDLTEYNSESVRNSSTAEEQGAFVIFHDSQFLVFVNRIVAFISAILALVYTRHKQMRLHANRWNSESKNSEHLLRGGLEKQTLKPSAPLYEYIYCSLSNTLSSWCQYEALKFVNFPTQCLSKSCKVIPVMLMSKIVLLKRYSKLDYLCALLLALGMFVFMFNQPEHNLKSTSSHLSSSSFEKASGDSNGNNLTIMSSGLIILALYLTFDSFTSNWQQSLYTRFEVSNWQMMAATNFYSILLTLTSLHQLGNLEPAFKLLASSSLLLRDCLLMSIMSSIGQMFVYYTIKRFGSVVFTVIMTLRQFFSILLSCAVYGHKLNFGSGIGLTLVFFVVGFHLWYKSRHKHVLMNQSKCQDPAESNIYLQFKSS